VIELTMVGASTGQAVVRGVEIANENDTSVDGSPRRWDRGAPGGSSTATLPGAASVVWNSPDRFLKVCCCRPSPCFP